MEAQPAAAPPPPRGWTVKRFCQAHMQDDSDRLRELFKTFDADGSGTLDAEELLAILTRGSAGLSLEDAQEIVRDFDENMDGVLSVDEFVKAMNAVEGDEEAKEPAVDAYVKVTSGEYAGRVGVIKAVVDNAGEPYDNKALDPPAYTVRFLDGTAGAATIIEKVRTFTLGRPGAQYEARVDMAEGALEVISKAQLEAIVTADRAKRDAERKALDAAKEAELQTEWEAKGKTGRVPRVGADRTSPIAPQWWDLPWFDAWVAGGCDHQLLGISVEGMVQALIDWGWLHSDTYKCFARDLHPGLEWVTAAFGEQKEDTGPIGCASL